MGQVKNVGLKLRNSGLFFIPDKFLGVTSSTEVHGLYSSLC